MNLQGGSFSAAGSAFLAAGRNAASLFILNGTGTNFSGLTLSAAAGDFASVLEARDAELVLSGVNLGVSARDTCALTLTRSPALVIDSVIHAQGSFSARAVEFSGSFPRVQNCRFHFEGEAKRSEVFSGMEGAARQSPDSAGIFMNSLSGNVYSGFSRIWNGITGFE